MDEYDLLLKEINREKKAKEEKKFWRGKKWNKKQIKLLEEQMKPPLQLNRIKSGQEIQREIMRVKIGLTNSEGLTLTEENMNKLMSDLDRSTNVGSHIILGRMFFENFIHFSSYLINKYFTKE